MILKRVSFFENRLVVDVASEVVDVDVDVPMVVLVVEELVEFVEFVDASVISQ